jgi:hypothetical protein
MLMNLSKAKERVPIARVQIISLQLAQAYTSKTPRAVVRDLRILEHIG